MDNDRQSLNFINDVRACPAVIYFRFQALPQHHRGDSSGAKTTATCEMNFVNRFPSRMQCSSTTS